ncbi:MAG: molybdopterin oxidoreductase [Firmicutes bacterium]|nr:molybdopterin oxidoreductase [Bacillota bacterium]
MREKLTTICGVCPGGCGIEAILDDGRLVEIKPLQETPFSALCVRGKFAPEVVHSPDRLLKPLIRVGERGEGKFREANWDEALDLVADQMLAIKEKYGPQAVMSHSGRGAFEQSMLDFNGVEDSVASKLLLPFGSPNIASVSSLCYVSFGVFAPMTTFGLTGRRLLPDFENSHLIVVWGANPGTDSPPFIYERILKAQQKGIKMIVIDHMRSDIASRADQWVAVRSGSDGALALGLLRVIINENLYDKEFVSKWTTGFEELRDYVQAFTPEMVENTTGVPQETVLALAREIAGTKQVTLKTYTGLEYSNCGVQTIRAVYILWALTGNLDVPGGLYIDSPEEPFFEAAKFVQPEGVLPIGANEYPLFYRLTGCAQFMEFPKAVLKGEPYPIKALLNNGASILTSYPQPHIWEAALRKLDFMLVIDRFMTKDALFADVVLPATTYFENTSYQRYPGYMRLRQPILKPIGQARNDLFIFAEIAKRLGYGHFYPQNENELLEKAFARKPELLAELLKHPEGVRLPVPKRQYRKFETGLLRPDGLPGFNTPSGKLEIASDLLKECGYDPLPVYQEALEGPLSSPDLHPKYPLVMNTGARIHSTFRSQHLNIPGLLKLQPRPQVLIHPTDAADRNIDKGDKVLIRTKRGEIGYYANVTDRVMPGTVEINMGGGAPLQAPEWRDANANVLTDFTNRDPISGFPVFKTLLCQIEKAK